MLASKNSKRRWPRDHFSWSQYNCFRNQGPYEYAKRYLYGDNPTNPAMELGKRVAVMLEDDARQEDATLEQLRIFLPRYAVHEHRIAVDFNGISLLAFLDGFTPDPLAVGEYKTGRLWTQQRADETEQLDFYALMLHLSLGIKPEDIPLTLHWMPTEWNNGDPQVTGDIENFKTRRDTMRCLTIGKRIMDTWRDIGDFTANEYRSLGM